MSPALGLTNTLMTSSSWSLGSSLYYQPTLNSDQPQIYASIDDKKVTPVVIRDEGSDDQRRKEGLHRLITNEGISRAVLSEESRKLSHPVLTAKDLQAKTVSDKIPIQYKIHEIHGKGHESPLLGQDVEDVHGVVTAIDHKGFFIQDPSNGDAPASKAIYIFCGRNRVDINVGDEVQVSGRVTKYPRNPKSGSLSLTQIAFKGLTVISTNNPLPDPIFIGAEALYPPREIYDPNFDGNIEDNIDPLNPERWALDFYRKYFGMLVQIEDPIVVGPSRKRFPEFVVVPSRGIANPNLNEVGGVTIKPGDFNTDRFFVSAKLLQGFKEKMDVGDLLGPITGVLGLHFYGHPQVMALDEFTIDKAERIKPIASLKPSDNQLLVGHMNVENLAAVQNQARFDELAEMIHNMNFPDVISMNEIQDNNGKANDGVVDASRTFKKLIETINRKYGKNYQFVDIPPVNNKDGGQPGGNIRVGFLFNADRVELHGDKHNGHNKGSSTDTVKVEVSADGEVDLNHNPGRINPTHSDFERTRKSLVTEFVFNGQKIYIVSNHFNSKRSDSPLIGRYQPQILNSEKQRKRMARQVKRFVKELIAKDPDARVIVVGDMNDFQFSEPLKILAKGGLLTNLMVEKVPENERWTYIHEGNSQALDHMLIRGFDLNTVDFEILNYNAGYSEQASDHNPILALLTIDPVEGEES